MAIKKRELMEMIFKPTNIGNITLENRIIRSATYEGMSNEQGISTEEYLNTYTRLAKNNIGAIITGFAYISKGGRAMQPKQAGIDDDSKIDVFQSMTDKVHSQNGRIFMQIAHCGRQTTEQATGSVVRGASTKRSSYFGSLPKQLSTEEALSIIEKFADAAKRCKKAGFDGVQIHAAHGYLIHQFILPSINSRKDIYGVDPEKGIGLHFLKSIIERTKEKCGKDFPILIKVSSGDDYFNGFKRNQFIQLIRFLDEMKVDAIEVSYGTMDHALGIFRGEKVPLDVVLEYNPKYKTNNSIVRFLRKNAFYPFMKPRIKMFSPMYNLAYAKIAKQHTQIPIICVGGFRTKQEMSDALEKKETDFISLCRPFICEPDLIKKLKANNAYKSKCLNCNICAVMCDSPNPTKCYFGEAV